jgi:hypothetical protein
MQTITHGKIRPAECPELKFDNIRMPDAQLQLRKKITGAGIFDILETVARKLIARIDDHQIIRLKPPPDIVDADGDEFFWIFQIIQRFAAAADDD